jgi:hypothetical protein
MRLVISCSSWGVYMAVNIIIDPWILQISSDIGRPKTNQGGMLDIVVISV